MLHSPFSHKGQNGKVLIISGSKDYYGATLLASKAALISGIDLVFSFIPEINRIITAGYLPEFIIQSYNEEFFTLKSVTQALALQDSVDTTLIGPGMGRKKETIIAIQKFISKSKTPLVLDADALYAVNKNIKLPINSVLTPHKTELGQIANSLKISKNSPEKITTQISKILNCTVILKGPTDYIVKNDSIQKNTLGNESLTKGGTGDILAGLTTGFLAQTNDPQKAALEASKLLGKAGNNLKKKFGYKYLTSDLLEELKKL